MTGERVDPRHSEAFQRGFSEKTPRARAGSGRGDTSENPPAAVASTDETGPDLSREDDLGNGDGRSFAIWTVALFVVGIGLCILSFALFSDFNGGRWGSIEATRDGEWVVTDTSGSEQRTVSGFEYLLFRYFSQSAVWIGIIGLAVVVANLFRIAPRRRS